MFQFKIKKFKKGKVEMKAKHTKNLCKCSVLMFECWKDTFEVPNYATIKCADLGHKTTSIMATGDDQNQVIFWRVNVVKPMYIMKGKMQNSEINAVTFNYNETKILAGDNRGSIQIWDLKA